MTNTKKDSRENINNTHKVIVGNKVTQLKPIHKILY